MVTLQGEVRLAVTTFTCPTKACRFSWQAPWRALLGLLPYRQVTLGVLVAVGVLRWGLGLQRCEVQRELAHRGIHISTGEISHLSDEFLVRFHAWFDASRVQWAPKLVRGLVLLIDGTQENGGRVTYRAVAYKQRVTVHAACLDSENEEALVGFLETVRDQVGVPRLIMRDGSQAAKNACDRVFEGVAQGLCHWHWLKNAGNALLGDAYAGLRDAVLATRQLARLEDVRKQLIEARARTERGLRRGLLVWARLLVEHVASARDSTGGRPFQLAYHDVMRRVHQARGLARRAVGVANAWKVCEPLLLEVKERLDVLGGDEVVREAFLRVDRRRGWFSRLRSWLGLKEARTGRPIEVDGGALEVEEVARRVYGLRGEARRAGSREEVAWMRVVSRFKGHRDELFPRVGLRDVPRTTSVIETSQREDRRACRRRTGRLSTRLAMERVGEHVAVWGNVENAWFAKNALRGVDLVGVFMGQDEEVIEAGVQALRAKRWGDRLPVAGKDREGLLEEFLEVVEAKGSEQVVVAWVDRVMAVA